ncbi:DNA polymerase [Pseudogracilibacillus sp. SO10305]|uniref:DNA polymerase n=1 Tax=Pseudogracilibacillus sp. SO10305 TaxID=3098292 RepID=UPI00300E4F48
MFVKPQKMISHTNLNHLLLMPKHYDLTQSRKEVDVLLQKHSLFKELYLLEKSISPILSTLEESGLLISGEWFKSGLQEKQNQLVAVRNEINQMMGEAVSDQVDEDKLHHYWKLRELPVAKGMDELIMYRKLHPSFQMMLTYKNYQNYLKMWGQRLLEKGTTVDGGVILQAQWRSFTSYTGRIYARNLPLTSLPNEMRNYIMTPKDYQIISLDINAAELRFMAYHAKCGSLVQKIQKGIDVLTEISDMIRYIFDSHDITGKQLRKLAKEFTYSLAYGSGIQTITKKMRKIFPHVTSVEVDRLRAVFYDTYPELQHFLNERGKSEKLLTVFGEIEPVAKFTTTQKKNFTLQHSVAVALKVLLNVLAENDFEIIHVVHDEVWFLVEENIYLDEFIKQVEERFEKEIEMILPGLPTNGILSKEKLRGEKI